MIRLERLDRRSVVAATAITLVALPSLWLTSRSDPSVAPNVATAGVGIDAPAGTPAPSGPSASRDTIDALGSPGGATWERPEFPLDSAPTTEPGRVVAIAVPADRSDRTVLGRATFRSTVVTPGVCAVRGVPFGTRVTVTNVDNGLSVTCTASALVRGMTNDVLLHTSAFASIADLTASPVPVQVTW